MYKAIIGQVCGIWTLLGGAEMNNQEENSKAQPSGGKKPVKLTPEQIKRIEELLAEIDDYGELHFVFQHGDFRYIRKIENFNVWDMERKKKS